MLERQFLGNDPPSKTWLSCCEELLRAFYLATAIDVHLIPVTHYLRVAARASMLEADVQLSVWADTIELPLQGFLHSDLQLAVCAL